MKTEEVCAYIANQYGVDPDYPFARTPEAAIFRHQNNNKWFAALLYVAPDKLGLDEDDETCAPLLAGQTDMLPVLNLKCDPIAKLAFKDIPYVLPGYHMNKEHWISVVLDSPLQREDIHKLIDASYGLTS